MAVEGINIEALLAPLAANGGGGEDLREDFSPASPYQRIRDARAEARAEERAQDTAAVPDTTVPAPWRDVKRHAAACLAQRSKDFEVAAWLTEALMRLDGLPGLQAGALVIGGLADRYWEEGFPRQDEDGWEARTAPLGGLAGEGVDGTLMQPLRRLALFRRADGTPVGLHTWQQAEEVATIPDPKKKKDRLAAGAPDLAAFETEARGDVAWFRDVAVKARSAARAWEAMAAALEARLGSKAPSTRRVAEALGRIQEIAVRLIGPLPPEETTPAATAAEEEAMPDGMTEATAAAGTGAGAAGPRPLRTRDDAIRQLEELAEWFRKTEPHSPMAYTLEDAVRRARMPLPELLAEVLPDNNARKAMLTMLGIKAVE